MSSGAYRAAEDSALMREALAGYSGKVCLEIGAGNGGNLIELEERFEVVVGTDIILPDLDDWRAGADFVLSDAAGCFREGIFDLIFFNPPYLPSDQFQDPAVDGGKDGLEVPLRFLRQALVLLRKGGRVLVLVSGEKQRAEIVKELDRNGLVVRKVAEKRLFYETLSIYEGSAYSGREGLGFK